MRILVLNGPNLNLLGSRQPEIYGTQTFEEYFETLRNKFKGQVTLDYKQSNIEGELIDAIHAAEKSFDGIVLNAGGYTHTSVAIRDAISSVTVPVIEVHISNIYAREPFRHTSLIAGVCKGSIAGFGLKSYDLAISSFC